MHVNQIEAGDNNDISGGWNVATTGVQADWRSDRGAPAAWPRTDAAARSGRHPQMSLVSSAALAAASDVETEMALITERWTGYGRDRVYVSLPDGQRVGWLNLLTGDRVVVVESFADHVRSSLDGWLADPENHDARPVLADDDVTIDLRDGAPIRAFLTRRLRRNQLAH